jgi:Tol biopolymer transport system component
MKVLPGEFATDPERLHRFEQEARAAAALNHPNILVLYDIGSVVLPSRGAKGQACPEQERSDDVGKAISSPPPGLPRSQSGHAVTEEAGETVHYLVTELLEGETLRQRLRAGAVAPAKAVDLGVQIAQGLAAAHEKGIIHRDLKPENVFLTREDRVKILDFGLARLLRRSERADRAHSEAPTADSPTREGRVLGTPGYMSPEQVRGVAADARTDIFAFGALMYEALSGKRAFSGDSSPDIQAAILKDDPTPLPRNIPSSLNAVVSRCLQKRPEDRFQSARDTCFALQSSFERLSSPGFGTGRMIGRRALGWTLAGAAAALVVVIVAWVRGQSDSGGLPPSHPRRVTSGPGAASEPAIAPGGSEIAYTCTDAGNTDIWVTDVRGGTPLRLTARAAKDSLPAWFPDGTALAFISDEGGTTSIWTIPRFGGIPMLLVPNASDPAISPDGTRIAFTRAGAQGFTRIWVAALSDVGRARALTGDKDGVWNHAYPTWSPDGQTLCYQAQRGLWLVAAEGGPARPFTRDDQADKDPAWSPDGRHIYFSSHRDGTLAIWRQPARGGTATRVTMGTGPETTPSLSKDGRVLAYTTFTDIASIVLLDLKAGGKVVLHDAPFMLEPALAPDRGALVYVSDKAGTYDLWRQPLQGGRPNGAPQRLTALPGTCVHPVFSPDGRWIAFFRVVEGQRDIWIMPSSGGAPENFTGHPSVDVLPEWSPDGREIAFVSDRGGTLQIWVAPVTEGRRTGEPRQVTLLRGTITSPAWSPDGRQVAFILDTGKGGGVWVADVAGRTPPRPLVEGGDPLMLLWLRSPGKLLVSGFYGSQARAVWEVPLDGSPPTPFAPAKASGPDAEIFDFDLSPDGTLLALQEWNARGDIWVLESQKGRF